VSAGQSDLDDFSREEPRRPGNSNTHQVSSVSGGSSLCQSSRYSRTRKRKARTEDTNRGLRARFASSWQTSEREKLARRTWRHGGFLAIDQSETRVPQLEHGAELMVIHSRTAKEKQRDAYKRQLNRNGIEVKSKKAKGRSGDQ
jgi:hypothetical protein